MDATLLLVQAESARECSANSACVCYDSLTSSLFHQLHIYTLNWQGCPIAFLTYTHGVTKVLLPFHHFKGVVSCRFQHLIHTTT